MTQPNPSDFSVNEKQREYTARIQVRGTISIDIKADSEQDARLQADAELARIEKEGYVELDDIDEIEVYRVSKDRPMFRVIREGRMMQVTHLEPGDTPRQPDERGF